MGLVWSLLTVDRKKERKSEHSGGFFASHHSTESVTLDDFKAGIGVYLLIKWAHEIIAAVISSSSTHCDFRKLKIDQTLANWKII